MKRRFNIIYWLFVSLIFILVFGIRSGSFINAFYFVSFLVPVGLVTSWYINNYLIPNYLLRKKYRRFIILSVFTVIISLDMIMIVVFVAFILIARYQSDQLNDLITQYYSFPAILYLTVIVNAFFNLVYDYLEMAEDMKVLNAQKNNYSKGYLIVRSNRQSRKISYSTINYIESMSDYIIIRTTDDQKIITRERISRIEQKLPLQFLRIHRSFIVNLEKVISFTREQVSVPGMELPISRTYKEKVGTASYL
ncbi:MAG: LytTR family DNA-binding domain-containing protein [Bacteroidota bacterium]|nr:LytTR family DNA-binding domain-containing protein [Bacteroidota bacterium]